MDDSSAVAPHLNSLRSRIHELQQIQGNSEEQISPSEAEKLIHDSALQFEEKLNHVLSDASNVGSLSPEDLGNFLDHLKKELSSVEGENAKVESDIQELSMRYVQALRVAGYNKLESELEGLGSSLDFLESQVMGRGNLQSTFDKVVGNPTIPDVGSEFKIMELNHQIEDKKNTLKVLKDLEDKFIRLDVLEKIDEAFSGLQVVEFEQNSIRLSLRTYIPSLDRILSLQRTEDICEASEQDHELLIELIDGTLEIENAEIFPSDVCISEIVDAAKSLRTVFSQGLLLDNRSSLEWLVRRVQDRIVLSTIRHTIVKHANKSRYSLDYVDKEGMIVAHLMGGLDVFIKVAHGWPILNAALSVIKIKSSSSNSSKETYVGSLSEVVKEANSLELHICENVTSFVDMIEQLLSTNGC